MLKLIDTSLRKGDLVHIGTSKETFKVAGIGYCGPLKGDRVNAEDFIQVEVPGVGNGNIFNIHKKFLTRKGDE